MSAQVISGGSTAKGSVLIAGFSEGLGSAQAQVFASAGYQVLTVARNSAAMFECDLSDPPASGASRLG